MIKFRAILYSSVDLSIIFLFWVYCASKIKISSTSLIIVSVPFILMICLCSLKSSTVTQFLLQSTGHVVAHLMDSNSEWIVILSLFTSCIVVLLFSVFCIGVNPFYFIVEMCFFLLMSIIYLYFKSQCNILLCTFSVFFFSQKSFSSMENVETHL